MNNIKGKRKALVFISIFLAIASSFAFVKYFEREESMLSREDLKREWEKGRPQNKILKNGDLIFRHARGTISNMLVHFSMKDSRYSHAGIISIEEGKIYVYHALGGEAAIHSELRKETMENFCRPAGVHSFGIYRLDFNQDQLTKSVLLARKYFYQKTPFDTKYDLSTDSALYCTEFVYKVIMQASGNNNYLTLTRVPGLTYVACDDLYLNSHTKLIYSYTYAD